MLDLKKLTSYSIGQVNGELALLLKKQKKLKIYVVLLISLSAVLLASCITLSIFCFKQLVISQMHLFLALAIVSFVLFLVSFSVLTFLLIVLIPNNKNNINKLKTFLEKLNN